MKTTLFAENFQTAGIKMYEIGRALVECTGEYGQVLFEYYLKKYDLKTTDNAPDILLKRVNVCYSENI